MINFIVEKYNFDVKTVMPNFRNDTMPLGDGEFILFCCGKEKLKLHELDKGLEFASLIGNVDLIENFVERGASVFRAEKNIKCPDLCAFKVVFELFLKGKGSEGQGLKDTGSTYRFVHRSFIAAIEWENFETLDFIIRNFPKQSPSFLSFGLTRSAKRCNPDMLKFFLSRGANNNEYFQAWKGMSTKRIMCELFQKRKLKLAEVIDLPYLINLYSGWESNLDQEIKGKIDEYRNERFSGMVMLSFKNGNRIFQDIAEWASTDLVNYLLENKAKPLKEILTEAVKANRIDILKHLISRDRKCVNKETVEINLLFKEAFYPFGHNYSLIFLLSFLGEDEVILSLIIENFRAYRLPWITSILKTAETQDPVIKLLQNFTKSSCDSADWELFCAILDLISSIANHAEHSPLKFSQPVSISFILKGLFPNCEHFVRVKEVLALIA